MPGTINSRHVPDGCEKCQNVAVIPSFVATCKCIIDRQKKLKKFQGISSQGSLFFFSFTFEIQKNTRV